MKIILLLVFSLVFIMHSEAKNYDVKFRIAAYCSPNQESGGSNALKRSAKEFKLKYDEISSGTSNIEVLQSMLNYIRSRRLDDDDIILFVDKNNALFLSDEHTILQTFLKLNKPFVASTSRAQPMFLSQIQMYLPPPPVNTKFCWLNTRSFMGRVGHVKKNVYSALAISRQQPAGSTISINEIFNFDYFNNQQSYSLDYAANLFLSMSGVLESEVSIRKHSKEVVTVETVPSKISSPKIVHCEPGKNGGGKILDSIYSLKFN